MALLNQTNINREEEVATCSKGGKLQPTGLYAHWPRMVQLVVFCLGLSGLMACRYQPVEDHTKAGGKLKVLCTTGIIADAVAYIGQGEVELEVLMGPGVDPHLYKAAHRDIGKLTEAQLIFYNGLHLEGKMSDVLRKLASHKRVVPVSDGIAPGQLHTIPGYDNTHDPHIWFNVQLWKQAVIHMGKTLALADSVHADLFATRTQHYCQQLDSLHSWVLAQWATVPQQHRVLVTAHDAFGYYGAAYGVEVRGLQGISTQAEFGVQDVASMVQFLVSRRIKAVFAETAISPKALEAVQAGCEARGWQLNIGPALYADALGETGTPEGTYIGMVRANTLAITQLLK